MQGREREVADDHARVDPENGERLETLEQDLHGGQRQGIGGELEPLEHVPVDGSGIEPGVSCTTARTSAALASSRCVEPDERVEQDDAVVEILEQQPLSGCNRQAGASGGAITA